MMVLTDEELQEIRDICSCAYDPQKPNKQLSHCELNTKLLDTIAVYKRALELVFAFFCRNKWIVTKETEQIWIGNYLQQAAEQIKEENTNEKTTN